MAIPWGRHSMQERTQQLEWIYSEGENQISLDDGKQGQNDNCYCNLESDPADDTRPADRHAPKLCLALQLTMAFAGGESSKRVDRSFRWHEFRLGLWS